MNRSVVGANSEMKTSLIHFDNSGVFITRVHRELKTDENRRAMLLKLGCPQPDKRLNGTYFQEYLDNQMIVTEEKNTALNGYDVVTTITNRDASQLKEAAIELEYENIICFCNRWMGITDVDGFDRQPSKKRKKSDNPA